MKRLRNAMMILFFCLLISILVVGLFYNYSISPVDKKDNEEIEVIIESGSGIEQIGETLKEKDLIHGKNVFKLYCYIYKTNSLKAGTYKLSKSMSLKEIVNTLSEGNNYNPDEITITFKEGLNMRGIAKVIEKNTNNSYEDTFNTLKDSVYIDSLINKYWFLTDDIKNTNIYYPLEGYLYPDTYKFKNKDVTVKEIFKKLLDEEDKFLTKYKSNINDSKYNIHQLLSLASVVELEGVTSSDRANIASVFYNRLNKNMPLGSDVTAYYANKVDLSERDLTVNEYNVNNPYNTRVVLNAGKIPIGPICSIGETSLKAVLNPTNTDYYYFVSDKNRKIYFSKTYQEQVATINKLKQEGKWFTW